MRVECATESSSWWTAATRASATGRPSNTSPCCRTISRRSPASFRSSSTSSAKSSPTTTKTRSKRCTRGNRKTRRFAAVAQPIDLSELHAALDRLRPQLCHCGLKGECLGCKGIEMVRAQAEAVAAAASQPILIQVAQESAMKDMTSRFQAMSERLMADPEIRRSAEQMQEKLMSDPETRQLLEELMRRLGGTPPPEELN